MQTVPSFLPMISLETGISIVFLVIAGLYVLFSAVFYYHWISYSNDAKVTSLTFILYAGTTLPLFFFLAGMTFIL